MVYQWESWRLYPPGAVVEHQGTLYQVIRPHRSEPNWQPPHTRALWSRLLGGPEHENRSAQRPHGVERLGTQSVDEPDGKSDPPQPCGSALNEHMIGTGFDPPAIGEGWVIERRNHFSGNLDASHERSRLGGSALDEYNDAGFDPPALRRGRVNDEMRKLQSEIAGVFREEYEHEYRFSQRHHGAEGQEMGSVDRLDGKADPPQPGGRGLEKLPPMIRDGWLSEKRKHQFEIVGAILGSLSRDGGVFAFSRNEAKEAVKSAAWATRPSREKWLQGAYAHTEYYTSARGHLPAVYWILVDQGDPIPHNAIDGGREAHQSLYIGRVFYMRGLHVGKVSAHTGCDIVSGGKEIKHFDKYEILCGDQNAIKWVKHCQNDGKIEGLINGQKWNPVEGGRDGCGRCQFISQVECHGNVYPCKALAGSACAYYPSDGTQNDTNTFAILVYSEAVEIYT